MLGSNDAYAIIAVKNIETAQKFYEEVLGLTKANDDPRGIYYHSGNNKILVYETPNGGTNNATSVTWHVDNVPDVVSSLKALGVTFEQYDIPNVTYENFDGDIHIFPTQERAAWFRDPDGNILCVSDA